MDLVTALYFGGVYCTLQKEEEEESGEIKKKKAAHEGLSHYIMGGGRERESLCSLGERKGGRRG